MKRESNIQVLSRGQKDQPVSQIYQVSTMTSLLDGVYDGDFELSEIPKYGDFGIGTFNKLDGELIGFDGEFYRLRSDEPRHRSKTGIVLRSVHLRSLHRT